MSIAHYLVRYHHSTSVVWSSHPQAASNVELSGAHKAQVETAGRNTSTEQRMAIEGVQSLTVSTWIASGQSAAAYRIQRSQTGLCTNVQYSLRKHDNHNHSRLLRWRPTFNFRLTRKPSLCRIRVQQVMPMRSVLGAHYAWNRRQQSAALHNFLPQARCHTPLQAYYMVSIAPHSASTMSMQRERWGTRSSADG